MSTKTEKLYVSYQAMYGFIFNKMAETFDDWPIDIPPNMIVLNRYDNSPNLNDPRGPLTLGEITTGYCPPPSKSIGTAFPYWYAIRMYHPAIVKAIREQFESKLTHMAGAWFLIGSIAHELIHFVTMALKYFRIMEYDGEKKRFASELYEHHVLNILGGLPDEQQTERLTIQALTAIVLCQKHLSLQDLYDNTLLIPIPNGQFFQGFTDRMRTVDEINGYQAALMIQYRHCLMKMAFGNPVLIAQYQYELAKVLYKLQASASKHHEKYGRTWKVYDITTSERSKWLT